MTLTKRDLVMRISEETGLIQHETHIIVQKTLDYIVEALSRGDKVELRNFGVFSIRTRKPRVGRNPKRPEVDVPIPQIAIVKFKPGRIMKRDVAKLPPPSGKSRRALKAAAAAALAATAAAPAPASAVPAPKAAKAKKAAKAVAPAPVAPEPAPATPVAPPPAVPAAVVPPPAAKKAARRSAKPAGTEPTTV